MNILIRNACCKLLMVRTACSKPTRMLAIVVFALGISTAFSANATCSFVQGSFQTGSLNMGNITVAPNVAVGTVIATKTLSSNELIGAVAWDCGGNNLIATLSFAMSGAGASGIYPTSIPGIGIRIYAWTNQSYYMAPTVPTLIPKSWTYSYSSGAYGLGYQQYRIDLVATGPVGNSGTNTLTYNVAPWISAAASDGSGQLNIANLAVTATVTTPTCSVTTSSVAVTLPTAFAGNLNSGSTGATPFSLGLNCSSGANVNITFTDASNLANTSTTLGLSPDSTATGVGLQILNGSTPIAYGPDSATVGNTNQWFVGRAAGGVMTIPLTARYVRTTGGLGAGTVKALATFTMSYQ